MNEDEFDILIHVLGRIAKALETIAEDMPSTFDMEQDIGAIADKFCGRIDPDEVAKTLIDK